MSTRYTSPEEAIQELLSRAEWFDDKPHQLFSCIANIARQYAHHTSEAEIVRLMERAYDNIGSAPQVWRGE